MNGVLKRHWLIALIAVLFAATAVVYSLVTPIFEASDEITHYPVVQHIATTGELPIQKRGVETLWVQEGSQPPLYYMLSAALTFWIDTNDLEEIHRRNPHAKLGIPLDPDNRNMILHTDAEEFPWHGTVLAVHIIRFFSILLGSGSVILIYFIALEAVPDNRWIAGLAAALTAFNPMFLFITGSVNNDNLTILLSSWTILLGARIIRTGLSRQRVGFLAVASGLAILTKISGLTLLPIIALSLLAHAAIRRDWRSSVWAGVAVGVGCVVIAGWWYLRNLQLYGELLGLDTHVAIAGGRSIGLIELVTTEWYGFWVSYWALFGAVNILAAPFVYTFYLILSIAAVIGLLVRLLQWIRSRNWQSMLVPALLLAQILTVLAGVIRWTMTTYASQGRLIFPALGALSTLTAIGLLNLVPERARSGMSLAVAVPLFAIALASPLIYIAPAYAPPATVLELPDDATPVDAQFGELSLIGATVSGVNIEEGGRVPITLYWQAQQQIDQDYSIYLHALGRQNDEIGKIDTYPGAGTMPTSQMQPGTIYVDHYSLELDSDFAAPTSIRILIGAALYEENSFESIAPTQSNGSERENVVIEAGVAYPSNPDTCLADTNQTPTASFGGFALLWTTSRSWDTSPGEIIDVELTWDRMASTSTNWTVFVHLIDSVGQPVAQSDSPPLGGYYPTSLWLRPCRITDVHQLQIPESLPSGSYQVIVGLYNPADPAFTRAVAADSSGQPYPNFAVPVGSLEVAP